MTIATTPTLPLLSVVIPCYNSSSVLANNLPFLLNFLSAQPYTSEVLVVDDGSRDGQDLETVCVQHGVRHLRLPENRGKGAAVRLGMLQALGEIRLFTDADIPYETEAITAMVHYLKEMEYHLVVGDRKLPGSVYFQGVAFNRGIGSKLFSRFVGNFVASGLYDTQCGIKAFRREAAEDLFGVGRINGFAFDVELLYLALKRNYDIKRIPVKLRSTEGSSVSLLRHSLGMMIDVANIILNHYRKRYTKKS